MIKILIAGFAIIDVSVLANTSETLSSKRITLAGGIPSLPKSGDYEFVGCYTDKSQRAIPNYAGDVSSADACRIKAQASGHDVFGLQYGGQCFTGNSDTQFDKYGIGPAT